MSFDEFREMIGGIAVLTALVGLLSIGAWRVWCVVSGWDWRGEGADEDDGRFKYCSECGYDLRRSPKRCPECGTSLAEMRARRARAELDPHALRDNWPSSEVAIRRPAADEVPVQVHQTANLMEANLLVDQLKARGIQAGVRIQQKSRSIGRGDSTETHRLIMVPSGDLELANAVIDSFRWRKIAGDEAAAQE